MFLDQRIQTAALKLEAEDLKVLSLDIFDTLLARRVPCPPDVFLRMGLILQEQGKLVHGIKPDSFAAIRYQTEHAARAVRQSVFGDREITIHEIYKEFPPHVVSHELTPHDLIALELRTEMDLAFANMEMVALALRAKENGKKLALISNTYIPEKELLALVKTHAPSLPAADGIFVSGENRMGKRTGLMQKMCTHFGVRPSEILHIGDNPVSDKMAAQEVGLNFIDYGACDDGFDATLTDEQAHQWYARACCFGAAGGDYGLTWLRKQSSFWKRPDNVSPSHEPFYRIGARLIGPLLTGFTGWATQRMKQEKGATLFGLLREGDLLTRLVRAHDPSLSCKLLPASRMSVALATFAPHHPEYLEDFLTRRGFWPIGTLIEQLGFPRERAKEIADPEHTLDTIPPKELTRRILQSSLAKELFDKSAARRMRLLTQLKHIGALDQPKLFLLDLGYAATIQRALQRVFTIEKLPITTHGLYAVAVHVSLGTQREGGIVEGFMAQNGNPNDFSCAYGRSPEIIELFCLPPYGTVIDYLEDGTPVFQKETRSEQQIIETGSAQQGILDFARYFIALANTAPQTPDFNTEAWRQQMRDLALRIITHPTAAEAKTVAHWVTDSDMGLISPRPIVSAGAYQEQVTSMEAAELVKLPRREVPWLFGLAATLSYAKCRQSAQLIMRRETDEAFKD